MQAWSWKQLHDEKVKVKTERWCTDQRIITTTNNDETVNRQFHSSEWSIVRDIKNLDTLYRLGSCSTCLEASSYATRSLLLCLRFSREGGNKRCFCPSVCRVHSEPKDLACPNLVGRFPTLDATRIRVSKSNGQSQVHRAHADTHRAPYLPNAKFCELRTWYTDGGRRPASAIGAMTSKVKGQGHKVTWSVWAVLAQCCTCVRRRGIPCRPNTAATLLVKLPTQSGGFTQWRCSSIC